MIRVHLRRIRPTRVALVLTLSLLVGACSATPSGEPASAAAGGTEILWDRYGVPHIFAPDHPSLFHAYGYAQMEAHSELLVRLYAQARGRGAEFYGPQYLESDRWVRTNGVPGTREAVGDRPERRSSRRSSRRSRAGLNAWASEHQAELSPAAQAVLPLTRRGRLRARPARDPLRLGRESAAARGPARPLRKTRCTARTSGRSAPSRSATGKAHPDEQLAPAVGRHPHLLRGAAHRARRHVVRRRVGRLPGAAPVLHRVRRLDADHQQPGASPISTGWSLKDGGYVLDGQVKPFETHTETHQGEAAPTADCRTSRSPCGAACTARWSPSAAACRSRCAWRRSTGPKHVRAVLADGPGEELRGVGGGDADAAAAAVQHRLRRPRRPHRLRLQRHAAEASPPATTASGRAWCRATSRI